MCTNWRVFQATSHKDNRANLILSKPARQYIADETYIRQWGQNVYGVHLNHDFFTGCVLETDRTLFADWLHIRPVNAPDLGWAPLLPVDAIESPYSKNHRDRIWECQCLLQEMLVRIDRSDRDLPASLHLIALFILPLQTWNMHNCDVLSMYPLHRKT